jgi:hypothetical protein
MEGRRERGERDKKRGNQDLKSLNQISVTTNLMLSCLLHDILQQWEWKWYLRKVIWSCNPGRAGWQSGVPHCMTFRHMWQLTVITCAECVFQAFKQPA